MSVAGVARRNARALFALAKLGRGLPWDLMHTQPCKQGAVALIASRIPPGRDMKDNGQFVRLVVGTLHRLGACI